MNQYTYYESVNINRPNLKHLDKLNKLLDYTKTVNPLPLKPGVKTSSKPTSDNTQRHIRFNDDVGLWDNSLSSSQMGDYDSLIHKAVERSKQGTYDHQGSTIQMTNASHGQCTYGPSTFFKELNLQGSFWNTNDPETAMSTNLTQRGFDKIWDGNYSDVKSKSHLSILRPGDLMITYGVKNNGQNSSHIAMWNGEKWVSDFVQKGDLVYNKERLGQSGKSVEILRLNPSKIQKAEKGMKFENDSGEKVPVFNDDKAFELFLSTCPDNIRYTDPKDYRIHRYWELHGKPKTFWEAVKKGDMFKWVEKDKAFHGNSVAQNENGEIEFMKYPNHSTVHMETDWYKLGKVYPEDGEPFLLTPEHGEAYEEWQDFKNNYDLDESGEFFKYVPKKKDVPKDAEGAKIIVIEKEAIKEPEEKDPLKCLLCQIMNAMGHRHHAFSELRPDKLTDIFGGNAEIVIQLGGPEKAYDEDAFEEMLKDILPVISTSKKYTKDDIANIRSKKAEHGTSMKRLLSLMDDDKVLKAFNGMQLFKTGGEIQFDAKGGQLENLSKITIEIGENEYQVYEAKTDEQKKTGLKGVTHLKPDEGMIFYWDEPQDNLTMTMVDCKIPLKIVSFNEDFEVLESPVCSPNENPIIMPVGTKYVVELHPDANIKKGDDLDLPGDEDEYVMQVLGSDGSIQMQLKGGERIFSRPNTKMLIKWAKRAYNSKSANDYRRLGKLLFKYLDQQDNREPEYVSLDSKNA